MVAIPSTIDILQGTDNKLEVPEIRVWCHPHYIGIDGDDYYEVFPSFVDALSFISTHKEAEDIPLVAFRGRELNL